MCRLGRLSFARRRARWRARLRGNDAGNVESAFRVCRPSVRNAADPLPLVRSPQPDRIHLWRRRDGRAAGHRCARLGVVRVRLSARQSQGPARRAVAAQRRLPQLVPCPPRHAHARHHRQRADRSGLRRRRSRVTQRHRLPAGGIVDRGRPLRFEYDGVAYEGYAGDTLASAMLANGIHLVGRSFKYHRPRGIFSAGTEEPNALVQLGRGARTEPNVRATTLELYEGLVAASQNCWPSVRLDIGALNNAVAPLIPAGFYYKTFMWPPTPRWWLRYEHVIRRAAGMGRTAMDPDPDHYEHQYAHCDVLVIGGGASGLAAARAAAHAGARVIVCNESARWGGELPDAGATIDGRPADDWMAGTAAELAQRPNVR